MRVILAKIKNALKIEIPRGWDWADWQAWLYSPAFARFTPGLITLTGLWCGWILFSQCLPLIHAWRFNPDAGNHLTPTIKIPHATIVTSIAQYHVFGISANTQRIAQGNLELRGVFLGLAAMNSTAVIGTNDNTDEAPYSVGDELPDGSRLVAVLDDHIIIDRHGLTENLFLKPDSPQDFNQAETLFVSNDENAAVTSENLDNKSASNDG
jgi:hypothetical protein